MMSRTTKLDMEKHKINGPVKPKSKSIKPKLNPVNHGSTEPKRTHMQSSESLLVIKLLTTCTSLLAPTLKPSQAAYYDSDTKCSTQFQYCLCRHAKWYTTLHCLIHTVYCVSRTVPRLLLTHYKRIHSLTHRENRRERTNLDKIIIHQYEDPTTVTKSDRNKIELISLPTQDTKHLINENHTKIKNDT